MTSNNYASHARQVSAYILHPCLHTLDLKKKLRERWLIIKLSDLYSMRLQGQPGIDMIKERIVWRPRTLMYITSGINLPYHD